MIEVEFGALTREVVTAEPEQDLGPSCIVGILYALVHPLGIYETVFGVRYVNTTRVRAYVSAWTDGVPSPSVERTAIHYV